MKTEKHKMKIFGKVTMLMVVSGLFITLVSSCSKEDNLDKQSLAVEVAGTYSGTLKNSLTNETNQATVTVSIVNDSVVYFSCNATDFDSTMVLQLYPNNDSIMLCYNGQDHMNGYGQYDDNHDMCNDQMRGSTNTRWNGNNMTGSDMWRTWEDHLNSNDCQSAWHDGAFDVDMNTCSYAFRIRTADTTYYQMFSGVKN